jgi:hypothetical protein
MIGATNINSITISNPEFSEMDDCVGPNAGGQICDVEIFFSPCASPKLNRVAKSTALHSFLQTRICYTPAMFRFRESAVLHSVR